MGQTSPYDGIPLSHETPWKEKSGEQEYRMSLVKELSPQEHIKEQIAWLRGELWDEKEKKFIKIDGIEPFMNAEGIEMFFQYATCVLSPVVTMSNYRTDHKKIHEIVGMIVKNATIHFHLHWKDYGITRKTKIKVLNDKLLVLGLSAMYKALLAGDRKAATSNISESISNIQRTGFPEGMPEQKRRSIFGGWMRR